MVVVHLLLLVEARGEVSGACQAGEQFACGRDAGELLNTLAVNSWQERGLKQQAADRLG